MSVSAATLVFVHLLDRIAEHGEHWIGVFFTAELPASTPRNLEPHKHGDMQWFRTDDLLRRPWTTSTSS